jgi:hypothetical protein
LRFLAKAATRLRTARHAVVFCFLPIGAVFLGIFIAIFWMLNATATAHESEARRGCQDDDDVAYDPMRQS